MNKDVAIGRLTLLAAATSSVMHFRVHSTIQYRCNATVRTAKSLKQWRRGRSRHVPLAHRRVLSRSWNQPTIFSELYWHTVINFNFKGFTQEFRLQHVSCKLQIWQQHSAKDECSISHRFIFLPGPSNSDLTHITLEHCRQREHRVANTPQFSLKIVHHRLSHLTYLMNASDSPSVQSILNLASWWLSQTFVFWTSANVVPTKTIHPRDDSPPPERWIGATWLPVIRQLKCVRI